MIFKGTTPRALSWTALAALLVCGAALLPLRPTWGQDRPGTPTDNAKPVAPTPAAGTTVLAQQTTPASGSKISDTAANSDIALTSSIGVPRDIEEAKDAVELLQAQLEAKKAELLEARALVEQSHRQLDRLSKLRAQGTVAEEEVEQVRTEITVREARLQAKQAQIKEAEVRLRQANRWLSRLQSGGRGASGTGATSPVGTASSRLHSAANDVSSGGPTPRHTVGNAPANATTPRVPAKAGTGNKITDDPTTPAGGDQRLRELEMKLEKLLKEVDALRREIRRQPAGGAGGATNQLDPTANSGVPKR